MKVGLFFGSFNPIHKAHISLVEELIQIESQLDEVWLVVSPQNPFKSDSSLLKDEFRLELTKLAVKNKSKIKVSDVEFSLPKPSYT